MLYDVRGVYSYENLIGAAGVALELVVGAQSLGRREVPAQHLKTFKTMI